MNFFATSTLTPTVCAINVCFALLAGCSTKSSSALADATVPDASDAITPPVDDASVACQPYGIYASSGFDNHAVLANPNAKGVLVRVNWREIEPEPGEFDFSTIETQRLSVVKAGKAWTLAVRGGPASPQWLYGDGLEVGSFKSPACKIGPRTHGECELPKFWDPTLQERLRVLAASLGATYASHAELRLVYVPQMTNNGIEGHFNGVPDAVLTDAGLTSTRWVQAVKTTLQSFADAFPGKGVAVELHDLLGSAAIPKEVISALSQDNELADRAGVAIWWLSGRRDYQAELLDALRTYQGAKYAQAIASAETIASKGADFAVLLAQAQDLGIRYVEVWEQDFDGTIDDKLLSFNEYAETKRDRVHCR